MSNSFAVDGIDHVELFVTDWEDAKAWYERVLGVTPAESFAEWWQTGAGPLVLSMDGAETKLALFERDTATRGESASPHRVAFRTDAEGFIDFLDRLPISEVTDRSGEPITPEDVIDHGLSYSIYFTDLDGNWLELTTNQHEAVSVQLG